MKRIHQNISSSSSEAVKNCRGRIELLLERVGLLDGKDRVLMTMYLENGNSCRQLAKLAGVNEANISRRIKKLTKRLIGGEYLICLRNRDMFTAKEMSLAKDYFLRGLSIKEIADKQSMTYYRTRETLVKLQQIIELINKLNR